MTKEEFIEVWEEETNISQSSEVTFTGESMWEAIQNKDCDKIMRALFEAYNAGLKDTEPTVGCVDY